ncbi:hypothetical protein [uncultured Dysosmobacter sp.]|uniref:hypothetical protein n=1 Tax=uncultured Dysosmobacter sp. TaxID=2591384 RepID=UPI00261E140D|nr:hypothetical protein [uncultured Dysosmobacter sp.]
MKTKQSIIALTAGVLMGASMVGSVAGAAEEYLQAKRSTQQFFVDGQRVELEAYAIGGHNYVKLRDEGRLVDFGVDYDTVTNSVRISTATPYSPEAKTPTTKGTVALPTDGSRYVPKEGDVVRCDDGYEYAITDVSRWDANAFADGPLGALPTPTCDWSLLNQPVLPDMEVRHYNINGEEYLFIRNLYETRRMLYTLYNAIGANEQTWRDGAPVLRKGGTQFVRIELSIPKGSNPQAFWPWKPERLTEVFNSCPPGTYQMEAWDVYKNGVFQKTEYDLRVK